MGNVRPINPPYGSQEATFVRLEHGLAIVRGGDVQAVIRRDELPELLLVGATLLQETARRDKVAESIGVHKHG